MKQYKRFWMLMALMALLVAILSLSQAARAQSTANLVEANGIYAANLQSLVHGGQYNGYLSSPQAGDAADIANKFIVNNAATLGLTPADVTNMIITDRYTSPNGVTHIYYAQQHNGIAVFNGAISISIMPNGQVLFIGNRFVSDLGTQVRENTTAKVTALQAVEKTATHLGLQLTAPLTSLQAVQGASQQHLFSHGGISQNEIPVHLVYDTSGKTPRLAWNVNIYQLDSLHWWHVRVDANTGEVLSQNDWVVNENFAEHMEHSEHSEQVASAPAVTNHQENSFLVGPSPAADGSSYQVYGLPIESPNHSSPASPADGRTVNNQPADLVSNPFGWHDTNNAAGAEFTTTQGNNAHAYTDTDANNSPDTGSSPSGGAGLDFLFTLDLAQAPSAYRPAAVTNLFFWSNLMHDVSYRYGFTEAAGNFQQNNYGNGGAGNDYVLAEAQDGSGTNNANFSTPTDGSRPRMQMYVWTAPTPDKDGDFDNGIIAHEYGHGISIRLTGGPNNSSCLNNSEQMGEGWSDWQSVILTMRTGDTATTNRGVGTYALNQATNGTGIRPAPYNTNMSVNNYTYSNLPSMAIPHGVGFVWNTMLWEMNWGLINQYGFNEDMYRPVGGSWTSLSGNQLAHQLVMDGLKLQPCSPGFVDGRNAILAADQALTGGQNACIIWTAFAKRGLGYSAAQGSSSSASDGTAAFDLPAACQAPQPTNTPGPSPTATSTPLPTNTPGPQTCNTYTSSDVPKAISASGTPTINSVLNVSGGGTIVDVNVVNLAGTHTYMSDLRFTLNSPSGTGVQIIAPSCSSTDNFGLSLDDEAAGTFPCPPVGGGTYRPSNPLSGFDGQNSNGTWTLTIADLANADGGSLNSWGLQICTSGGGGGSTPTPVPTNTSTPLPTNTATPAPTNTATPVPTATNTPAPTATPGGNIVFTGSLTSGGSAIHPTGSYYYSANSGVHYGYLVGPSGTDFDLRLQKWNGSTWAQVASSTGSTSVETINYSGTAGYYRWRVNAYSGSGNYTLTTTRPN